MAPTIEEVESYIGTLTLMSDIYSFGSLALHVRILLSFNILLKWSNHLLDHVRPTAVLQHH